MSKTWYTNTSDAKPERPAIAWFGPIAPVRRRSFVCGADMMISLDRSLSGRLIRLACKLGLSMGALIKELLLAGLKRREGGTK